MPKLIDPDPTLPTIFTARDVTDVGMSRSQIAHRLRSGRWVALAPGVYMAVGPVDPELDPFAAARIEHVRRAIAAAIRHPGHVIARHSAAAVHGLPLASRLPSSVALVARPGGWTGHRPGLEIHGGELAPGDVRFRRVPFTSAARTCFDIARVRGVADGLAVGDAALARGLMSLTDMQHLVSGASAQRGIRAARTVAAHVSGLRESPLESASWAYFLSHRVELPDLQAQVMDGRGAFVARVDVLWEAARLVGECDGRAKYSTAGDLYREKLREDRLRELGFRVVRWGWRDLRDAALAIRVMRLLADS